MHENMKPHELVRQICLVFSDFDPEGDSSWPLRQIRDFVLDYNRALSTRYHGMSEIERSMLCKLMVFEAATRHVWSANTHTN